jgi:hypothetical protein
MDFTFLAAAFFSLLIGFIGTIIFVLTRGRSYLRLLFATVTTTVILDFALLLDWSRADEMTAEFLLTDFAFFMVYAVVGAS